MASAKWTKCACSLIRYCWISSYTASVTAIVIDLRFAFQDQISHSQVSLIRAFVARQVLWYSKLSELAVLFFPTLMIHESQLSWFPWWIMTSVVLYWTSETGCTSVENDGWFIMHTIHMFNYNKNVSKQLLNSSGSIRLTATGFFNDLNFTALMSYMATSRHLVRQTRIMLITSGVVTHHVDHVTSSALEVEKSRTILSPSCIQELRVTFSAWVGGSGATGSSIKKVRHLFRWKVFLRRTIYVVGWQ